MTLLVVLSLMGCLALSASSGAAGSDPGKKPGQAGPTARTTKDAGVRNCAWWTRHVRFDKIRVKKIRKRARYDSSLIPKYNAAVRHYHSALRIKNRVCAAERAVPPPLALTASEVADRVFSQASAYCNQDAFCYAYGNYDTSTCASKSTHTWSCYGYNLETYGDTCDFREVVSRSGYNGITSYRDLTYGGSDGFFCS
jgi:hypothetical protein